MGKKIYLFFPMVLLPLVLCVNAWSGPFAYITNVDSNNISVIDTATNTVTATIGTGSGPTGVAVNPAGTRVYVTIYYEDKVSVIDTASNTILANVPVGDGPYGVAVNPAGTRIYVTNFHSHTVSVIDAGSNTVIATIPNGTYCVGIAINPEGTRAYVANSFVSTVSVIDITSNAVLTSVPVGGNPYALAVNPTGTRVYVSTDANVVSVIDTDTNTLVGNVIIDSRSTGIAVSPTGTHTYVAAFDVPGICVIDNMWNTVSTTVRMPIPAVPTGLAVNTSGTRVYTANQGTNNVTVMDTQTNTIISYVPVGLSPFAIGAFVQPAQQASLLVVSGISTPREENSIGTVTITAKDSLGNVATSHNGTIHFTSTDSKAVLPPDYTFVPEDNGSHTFTDGIILKTAGVQSVTAVDTVTPTITGTQSNILVVRANTANRMYWADAAARKIQRAHLDGTGVQDLVLTGQSPTGIALDVTDGKMYWAESDAKKIRRANLDGSAAEDLLLSVGAEGIALDTTGRKMYWTDVFVTGKIQRANLNGTGVQDLITVGADRVGIALDVPGDKMYWTDRSFKRIQRSNLDGSGVETLISTGLMDPIGIAIDLKNGKMYWTDIQTHKIQRANLNGSGVEDLVTGFDAGSWIALDVTGGKMYWTGGDRIKRANLNGSGIETLVTGLSIPAGIALLLYPSQLCSKIRFMTDTGDMITTGDNVMSHYFMSGEDRTLNIMVREPLGFGRTYPDIGIRSIPNGNCSLQGDGSVTARAGQTFSFRVGCSTPGATLSPIYLPLNSEGSPATFDPLSGVFQWSTNADDTGKYLVEFQSEVSGVISRTVVLINIVP